MNIHHSELEKYLKSGQLRFVTSSDGTLYEYEDLILREEYKDIWKKQRSFFTAKKYWLKPDIKPGTIFAYGMFNDIWIRFNTIQDKKYDLRLLVIRKGNYAGKDFVGNEYYLWEEYWWDFVMSCTDEDWEKIQPKVLITGLTDKQLLKLSENPPLYKTDDEIKNLSVSI